MNSGMMPSFRSARAHARLWQTQSPAAEGGGIVVPYGDPHQIGGSDPARGVPIFSLLDPPPWESLPVLRNGGGGDRTDVVCGYLYSEDPLFDPRLRALPPVFV